MHQRIPVIYEDKVYHNRKSWLPMRCVNHYRRRYLSSWTGNLYFKPRYKKLKKKKKKSKPKQIWVPKKKSSQLKCESNTEVKRMSYEKFTEKRYMKNKRVKEPQFWLKELTKVPSSLNKCYKTPLNQIIFNEDIVWSNHFGENKRASKFF